MKEEGMFVLCVCLTFVLLGSTEGENITANCNHCTNGTNEAVTSNTVSTGTIQPAVTTPLPGNSSAHVTSNNHTSNTETTRPPPASSTVAVSSHPTATTASSEQPTASSGMTESPGAAASTTQHSSAGTSSSTSATTAKGGSAALFRCYSQLLVPVISILMYSA
ncbi:mucin-2-like [Lates japonicus]